MILEVSCLGSALLPGLATLIPPPLSATLTGSQLSQESLESGEWLQALHPSSTHLVFI